MVKWFALALLVAMQFVAASQLGPSPVWDEVYYVESLHADVFVLSRYLYGHGLSLGRAMSIVGYTLSVILFWRLTRGNTWVRTRITALLALWPGWFTLGHLATPHMLALAIVLFIPLMRSWLSVVAVALIAGSVHPIAMLLIPALLCLRMPMWAGYSRFTAVIVFFVTVGIESLIRPVYWHHWVPLVPLAVLLVESYITEVFASDKVSRCRVW